MKTWDASTVSCEATTAKVEEELKHLADGNWNWRVRQIARKEYLVVFPNKAMSIPGHLQR